MHFHIKDTLMIIIFILVIFIEFAVLLFSMFKSKDRKIQTFVLRGGFTKGELISKDIQEKGQMCHYRYFVNEIEYKISLNLKGHYESIDIYYNPDSPSEAYTLIEESFIKRYFYQFTPIIAITILLIAYKIIYG